MILANNNSPKPQTVPITTSFTGINPYTTNDTLLRKYAMNHTINEEMIAVFIFDPRSGFNMEYKNTRKIPKTIDTKLKKTIDILLNGGKPQFANTLFISLPTTGTIEIALIFIKIPAINPLVKTLFRLIDFIYLVVNYFVPEFSWR